MRDEVKAMLRIGVIEPSTNPWTSPIVPVRKKDGRLRLCVDYRSLNTITTEDRYQMPHVDELVECLGKAKYISIIDLCKGYYQVPMQPEDKLKTAFVTPFQVLLDGIWPEGGTLYIPTADGHSPFPLSAAYIDDIVIYSKTWEEHKRQVLQRLREAKLTAKPATWQCSGYLGHVVGGGEVQLDEATHQGFRGPMM